MTSSCARSLIGAQFSLDVTCNCFLIALQDFTNADGGRSAAEDAQKAPTRAARRFQAATVWRRSFCWRTKAINHWSGKTAVRPDVSRHELVHKKVQVLSFVLLFSPQYSDCQPHGWRVELHHGRKSDKVSIEATHSVSVEFPRFIFTFRLVLQHLVTLATRWSLTVVLLLSEEPRRWRNTVAPCGRAHMCHMLLTWKVFWPRWNNSSSSFFSSFQTAETRRNNLTPASGKYTSRFFFSDCV